VSHDDPPSAHGGPKPQGETPGAIAYCPHHRIGARGTGQSDSEQAPSWAQVKKVAEDSGVISTEPSLEMTA